MVRGDRDDRAGPAARVRDTGRRLTWTSSAMPGPSVLCGPALCRGGSLASTGMRVDCDDCQVRGPHACADCVVTVLLGAPPDGVTLDPEEQRAIEALADGGLIPPLRLVRGA